MAKAEATVEELVSKIERGELRLPEMQLRYVWGSTRVRDLLDSLYRGYPSGAILVWETDERVPEQSFAVAQEAARPRPQIDPRRRKPPGAARSTAHSGRPSRYRA
jgi:GAF domain-containing protein